MKLKTTTLMTITLVIICIGNLMGQEKLVNSIQKENITVNPNYDDEIGAITTQPKIQQAFLVIKKLEQQNQKELIMLTEIPAPPFKEEQRALKFFEMLKAASADSVWIDTAGNVIALRRGHSTNRTIALAAHLDTVFPEGTDVTVKAHGDTLFAPGIGDDTRGLMVVLTVLRAIKAASIETDANILFIGTVGEEGLGDLRGVKHLFSKAGPRIDAWIAVDGRSISRILHKGIGSHRYRITYRGPGGHSWAAFGLANPHHALGSAIQYFVKAADVFTAKGKRTSYNVGRFGGGTSVNSIPFESWMEVDMRSQSPDRLNEIDAILQKAVQRALAEQNRMRRHGPKLTVDVDKVGNRPSGEYDPESPLVQRAIAAIRFFNTEPELGTGSTDSNIPISLGIPAITIGRGGIDGGIHSITEWWMNRDGHLASQRALLILVAEAGLAIDSTGTK